MGGNNNLSGEYQSFINNNVQQKRIQNLETKINLNELKNISKKTVEDIIIKSINSENGECKIDPKNNN